MHHPPIPLPTSKSRARLLAVAAACLSALHASAAVLPVADDASLAAALASANPGDVVVLADGTYAGFSMTRSGAADAPITVRSANLLGATIASGVIRLNNTAHVTLSGLRITTPGATQAIDGENYRVAVLLDGTTQCRVTRCDFELNNAPNNTHWVMLGGAGDLNRVDHNDFGPSTSDGTHYVWPRGRRAIEGVTPPADRGPWAEGNGPVNPFMPRHTLIDHNHFFEQARGTAEAIVLGGLGVTGDYQDTFTTVEHNLFVNCDGDAEMISIKASSNTIRYNTIRTSVGTVSSRAGNENAIYGNIFLQGGKQGAAGIKIYERDHVVFNNYIEGSQDYPILVGGGNAYNDPSFSHAQVFRAIIVNNTIVNPLRQFRVGHGRPLPPVDSVIANNLLVGAGTLYSENLVPVNLYRAGNLSWPYNPNRSGFAVIDPQLVADGELQKLSAASPAIDAGDAIAAPLVDEDIDGQLRDALLDIGADEFSAEPITLRPLQAGDVGVAGPDVEAPAIIDLASSHDELWPPNHKMVEVSLSALVLDDVDAAPITRIVSVTSNQPAVCFGDWTPRDWEITGDLTVKLRAERNVWLGDRIYTITVESRDAAGNASLAEIEVTVPKSQRQCRPRHHHRWRLLKFLHCRGR